MHTLSARVFSLPGVQCMRCLRCRNVRSRCNFALPLASHQLIAERIAYDFRHARAETLSERLQPVSRLTDATNVCGRRIMSRKVAPVARRTICRLANRSICRSVGCSLTGCGICLLLSINPTMRPIVSNTFCANSDQSPSRVQCKNSL